MGRVRQKLTGITATGAQNMWECLQSDWKSISGEHISKLTARMVRVCDAACISGKGQ